MDKEKDIDNTMTSMSTRLNTLLLRLLQSPRRFPVEMALGVAFFIIAVCHIRTSNWGGAASRMVSAASGDILWLFVPLMVLTFWLHRFNRWAYIVSFFLFLPLMLLDLNSFLGSFGFGFTYVLAGILLVVGHRWMDNRSFAAHALHVVTQLFFGLLVTGILNGAVLAIVSSFLYVFGIDSPSHLYEHIIQFIWFVLAPQVCCTLIRQNEDEVAEPFRVLQLILNFILSPAVIIYTVILYAYFIKIVLEWDLPKGGVAWMVMGLVSVALIGCMAQPILSKRYYDWFYRRLALIAIPPLIMYWIGSIYRVSLYSFTESRFYLMVAGVLMTLFVLMLFWEATRRYQLMALILGAAIILFTYIPGISAASIGLRCQQHRLEGMIRELKLLDAATGKLNDKLDMQGICQDSLLCARYRDASSVIRYVREEQGIKAFEAQYGEWTHNEYEFSFDQAFAVSDTWYRREKPVELGEYSIMLHEDDYECSYDRHHTVAVRRGDAVVMEYDIDSLVRRDPALLDAPEQLLTYHNDSLMLVLNGISICEGKVEDVSTYNFLLFRRQGR